MLLLALVLGAVAVGLVEPELRRGLRRGLRRTPARGPACRYGARPTGPGGGWTRGDRLRGARLGAAGCLACLAVACSAFWLDGRFPVRSARSSVTSFVGLLFFLLGMLALCASADALARATFAPALRELPVRSALASPRPGSRAGAWAVSAIWGASLAAYLAWLWWFGPWHAGAGFVLWALAAAPLLLLTWSRTGGGWLRPAVAGAFLLCAAALYARGGLFGWARGPLDHGAAAVLLAVAPLAVGAWAMRRLLLARAPAPAGSGLPVLLTLLLPAAAWWARDPLTWPDDDRPESAALAAAAPGLVGCYEVEVGRWVPGGWRGMPAPIPARLRLDAERAPPGAGAYAGDRRIRPGWPQGRASWRPRGGGRVELLWSDGVRSLELKLARSGRGPEAMLRGTAEVATHSDGLWPTPRARAAARPIDCALVPQAPTAAAAARAPGAEA